MKDPLITSAFRQIICTKCVKRPAGSERLTPHDARSCEPECTIFINQEKLQQAALAHVHYETAIRNMVCQSCLKSVTAGDYCADNLVRSCPLSMYGGDAINTINLVQELRELTGKPAPIA